MADVALCLLVFTIGTLTISPGHAASFTVTPLELEMCGGNQTTSMTLSCRPTEQGITQVFAIEIGKTGSYKSVMARVTVMASHVDIVNQTLRSRMTPKGSISGSRGSLELQLRNLVDDDAATYYCSIAYMTVSVAMQETMETVSLHTLQGSVPKCNSLLVLAAMQNHTPVTSPTAGKCPNGVAGRSEALMYSLCSSPDLSSWTAGPKVIDICCQIPMYTPVATFEFGFYVQDERGMAGIFTGCTAHGFEFITQLCGHAPIKLTLAKTLSNGYIGNADNYHLVKFGTSGNPFG
ncbi:uncharacterized protein LOC124271097 [Haliotis rubra]|uniref:uncharacterized protein LOC124271097 n=1 Tax=Haliotis rubra TaxID=36100 RepID=UPI001EE544CF|nr:uncharacterized protein LOC124271097 [Haliotis rubra]